MKQISEDNIRKPSFSFSLTVFALVVIFLSLGLLVFGGKLQTLLFLSWLIVIPAGLHLGFKFSEIEGMAYDMIRRVLQPIMILLAVGAMVGAWILSGTVPTLIFYGLKIITPSLFLVTTVLLCSICSLFTGTSWGTIGTAGLAMVGIGTSMGFDGGVIAGAVVCGSYFGDKLSPLSDTTNLSPAVSGGKVMNHIKHMLWTTIPSYVITLAIFLVMGLKFGSSDIDYTQINEVTDGLNSLFHIGIIPLIPAIIVLVLLLKNKPPVVSILIGALAGLAVAMLYQGADITTSLVSLYNGFKLDSGMEFLDKLLNRGGIASMWDTVGIFIFSCGLGGMLNGIGVLEALLQRIAARIKTSRHLIIVTMLVGYISNMVGGTLSFAIVMTGTLMQPLYRKMRLRPENLSRTIEDVCTMSAPIIPWNTAAVYTAGVLGISAGAFIPYIFLAFITLVFTLIYAFTGFTIAKLDEGEEYGETEEYKFKPFKKAC